MIRDVGTFIIQGFLTDKMVSAGLFIYSHVTCYYSILASVQLKMKDLIIHGLIFKSTLTAKKLGHTNYLIDEQPFNNQENKMN